MAAEEVEGVATAYEAGRIVLERFRGRSSFPPAAQAADAFVRAREGLDALDALVLERCEGVGRKGGSGIPGALRSRGGGVRASDSVRPFSCGDGTGEAPVTGRSPAEGSTGHGQRAPAGTFAARARLAVR